MRRNARLAIVAALAFGTLGMAIAVWAQDPGPGPMPPGHGRMMSPERLQAHQQMMEQMRAHDARLDELVKAMNEATGQAKVDAIAAVLNEMIAQRRTMRAHMEQMRPMPGTGKMPPDASPPSTP